MLKKSVTVFVILCLALAGVALAGDGGNPLRPGDSFFNTLRGIENAQARLTVLLEEKIQLRNEIAERRLGAAMEAMGEGDVLEALADLEENERALGRLLAQDPDKNIAELVEAAIANRGARLREIIVDEGMPEGARKGAEKALANQDKAFGNFMRAMENRAKGLEKAEQARANAGQGNVENTDVEGDEGGEEDENGDGDDTGPPDFVPPGPPPGVPNPQRP